ncbi:MAG: hypothetical protein A2Z31_00475 [candidate division NC10 bacterium RBG_16_65_8]|nr:MAG: hypothetical protein A2Z31_00475 [candidate division NC10 bacterium RBG_16_65_8]
MCGTISPHRNEFLEDPRVIAIGYTPHFHELEFGLFLFNHDLCKTTLAINAGKFTDLYEGAHFSECLTGTERCSGYCLRQDELRVCPAPCECAYVRHVLDRVARWEKSPA